MVGDDVTVICPKMPISRFHHYHGENIRLLDEQRVAYRISSFAHAISFSEKPLHPMEIFLIEIERNERGWSGHLRIGLTQQDPSQKFILPQYALPDLANIGRSWILAVTKSHNKVYQETDGENPRPYQSILGNGDCVNTFRGPMSRSILKPLPRIKPNPADDSSSIGSSIFVSPDSTDGEEPVENNRLLPTDVGSRIGIVYVVKDKKAEMHFIINGEDQGPCAKDIPSDSGPLYAVVDVYGTTKQVRIIQIDGVGTLQNSCRDVILKFVKPGNLNQLPIPKKLKEYLRYEIS